MKLCRLCKIEKDLSQFSGKRHQCIVCRRSKYAGAECYTPAARRKYLLRTHYNISTEEFDQMFASQSGLCALCSKSPIGTSKPVLNVDHCHQTGKIRGLLCSGCNRSLGLLGDTLESIERVVKYLKGEL